MRRAFEDFDGERYRHGHDRVAATTMAVNTASRRVMEKAGLRHVRTFFAEWPSYIEGAEHGDVVYERSLDELRADVPPEVTSE
jgi:RimJ/RimL family protein N-acetyltransferase